MPGLSDKDTIRAILRRDPAWCVYALGDLSPRMFPKCQWFTPAFAEASARQARDLTLLLHDYGTSILFAMGTGSIGEALDSLIGPTHLQVQPDALDVISRACTVTNVKTMWRMARDTGPNRDVDPHAKRLTAADVPALERLYADGESTGESPDFFYPSMVGDGVFFGLFEGADLVAAAGTHLVAHEESAAAIGNIYTRRDRRGRGYGRIVTAAVSAELGDVETVGLNVRADNAAAIHLYESLGFVRHCRFHEALAIAPAPSASTRRTSSPPR